MYWWMRIFSLKRYQRLVLFDIAAPAQEIINSDVTTIIPFDSAANDEPVSLSTETDEEDRDADKVDCIGQENENTVIGYAGSDVITPCKPPFKGVKATVKHDGVVRYQQNLHSYAK